MGARRGRQLLSCPAQVEICLGFQPIVHLYCANRARSPPVADLVTMRKVREQSERDVRLPQAARSASELEELASPWERWWESPGHADAMPGARARAIMRAMAAGDPAGAGSADE